MRSIALAINRIFKRISKPWPQPIQQVTDEQEGERRDAQERFHDHPSNG